MAFTFVHSRNISLHVYKRVQGDKTFDDMHGHAFDPSSEDYQSLEVYYLNKYLNPILDTPLEEPSEEPL